jgi:protein tyrosine phosphatase
LTPVRAIEGSDYINASFIDGYRYRAAYIATQGPLLDTTEDFWRMLWEHNSTIVVMLTKLKEMGRVSVIYAFSKSGDDFQALFTLCHKRITPYSLVLSICLLRLSTEIMLPSISVL